jgi:CheY-like chemotaxis protein
VDLVAAGKIDLVLVDQHLGGMCGSDFLNVLRKKRLGIPAILITGHASGDLRQPMEQLGVHVVGKPAGGYNEFWKDLEPVLDLALKGESEIIESIRHAVDVTLKAGKTNVTAYLRSLLYTELLMRVHAVANKDPEKVRHILGVPPRDLWDEPPEPSLRTKALILILDHPELTVEQIAKQVGWSKSGMHRDSIVKTVLRLKNRCNYRGPSRYITADGELQDSDD